MKRTIHGVTLETKTKGIQHMNYIEVEAGTTGLKGIGLNQGSRGFVQFKTESSEMEFWAKYIDCNSSQLQIRMSNDAELITFIQALKFVIEVFEEKIGEIEPFDYEIVEAEE